jgi:hypothetical protein
MADISPDNKHVPKVKKVIFRINKYFPKKEVICHDKRQYISKFLRPQVSLSIYKRVILSPGP